MELLASVASPLLVALLLAIFTAFGAFIVWTITRNAHREADRLSTRTVELLEAANKELREQNIDLRHQNTELRDTVAIHAAQISDLKVELARMVGLVTSKADVEELARTTVFGFERTYRHLTKMDERNEERHNANLQAMQAILLALGKPVHPA